MKRIIIILISLVFAFSLFCGCDLSPENNAGTTGGNQTENKPGDDDNKDDGNKDDDNKDDDNKKPEVVDWSKYNLSAGGFVEGKIGDFSVYENTSAYRKVKTAEELLQALADAKYHYTNVWDENTNTYTQVPAEGYTEDDFKGTVHVIEIENDLNLGYYKLSDTAKSSGLVSDYAPNMQKWLPYLSHSDMVLENGISQIKVENTSNLLVYSKNGAKLTHCGFKLTSDTNVVFRNLQFDEMWQWEDAPDATIKSIGDYDWYGWAYFKISFCGYIWIDHCAFGKSFDGQIDYSNPDYTANAGVAFRAPYGADGGNGLHISWCNFNAGSDDQNGYIYKMMSAIEEDYQAYKADGTATPHYLYYNALRDAGASFEDILYGLAIPQKKGFLCGDTGDNDKDYQYNLNLKISFAYCTFKNLEDRVPKLRGGNAVMYNCVVDSSQYYQYHTKLRGLGATNLFSSSTYNKWKCALVSQGIVCGNGGSFYGENCIYRGIDTLLKNNDTSSNTSPRVDGGYKLVNCSYDKTGTGTPFVGSSSDAGNNFTNSNTSILKPDNFSWHTEGGVQPFTVPATDIAKLEEFLAGATYGTGAGSFEFSLLKSAY